MTQERAMQDDETWMGGDEENYTIAEQDRASMTSSPDNLSKLNVEEMDYVDVESVVPSEDGSMNPTGYHRSKTRQKKKTSATLEEDLQFSSEEELDEVPLNEFDENKDGILIDAEMPGTDDDSQQAAETMVQLGNMGYYHQAEGENNETLIYKGKYTVHSFYYFFIITILVVIT